VLIPKLQTPKTYKKRLLPKKNFIGGIRGAGRNYITTDEYYEKYNVKDKRNYQERVRTILTKEEKERNYNARKYMFKIEYKQNGKEKEIISKTFEDINNKLNIN
jgi:hypothetical protein